MDIKIIGLSSLPFKCQTHYLDSNKPGTIAKWRWRALYNYIVIFLLYLLINYTFNVGLFTFTFCNSWRFYFKELFLKSVLYQNSYF